MSDAGPPPPSDIPAEACVLGAMILVPDTLLDVRAVLTPKDFYRPEHAILCRIIYEMADERIPLDAVTIRTRLEAAKVGHAYETLTEILDGVPAVRNVSHYAAAVLETAKRRAFLTLCHDASQAVQGDATADQLAERFQVRAYAIAQRGRTEGDVAMTAGQAVASALEHAEAAGRGERPPALRTGLGPLDDVITGFEPGELILLGADTGYGKSTLANCVAMHCAREAGTVLMVSGEMRPREIGKRILQAEGAIVGRNLKTGHLTPEDVTAAQTVRERSHGWRYWIEGRALSAGSIGQLARRLAGRWHVPKLDLIVVDYLQIMRAPRANTRAEAIGSLVYSLKHLAMDLGTPVLCLSQFNRESNKAKIRPSVHSWKESGDVENAADLALLLWSDPDAVPTETDVGAAVPVEIAIAKARDGASWGWVRPVHLTWYRALTKFEAEP